MDTYFNLTNVLILEDNESQRNYLKHIVEMVSYDYKVYAFENIKSALNILSTHSFDLFLLDIEIKSDNQTSIDFAQFIIQSENYSTAKIIFISGQEKYALEAIQRTHCFNYLLKPYSKQEIEHTIKQCLSFKTHKIKKNDFFQIKVNKITHNIHKDDILYIESLNRRIEIQTTTQKLIASRHSLSSLLIKLNNNTDNSFIQCHRAYIVNLLHMRNIECINNKKYVILANYSQIPIGISYEEELKTIL